MMPRGNDTRGTAVVRTVAKVKLRSCLAGQFVSHRRSAEQGAGADRFQRGGTRPIFILRVLSLLVLVAVAAAQLERCAAYPKPVCFVVTSLLFHVNRPLC